ncbi:5'-nucleotidase C-terminal domain-containing protein [Vagococcus carniphilus]|uniref:5'-nucleotidase C-terminal domain-containing protein n=1 Tax=Vagococcus carniphilus TaxID=218144 RepID=UPI00288E07D6|nr:5'-nucleotidase C-terminal domain-containing protein [Vagococcus carniphilus]MDT2814286.1 5'-nucleotidase C-terminal domain-containing protein [Vagococcus carniphilus]MDT2864473.1 5'-nucleotidase C-terminal domain-containing protein [Vagococcus carniphilus]
MKSNKWLKRLNVSMLTFLLLGTVTPTASVMAETLSDKSDDLETTEVSEESSKTEKEEAKEVKISETKKDADGKDKKTESDEKEVKEDADKEKESTDKKKLTILGTSDVHGNVWDWSYEDDKEADLGFAKISTLVKQQRKENPNNILVDAGDNLQGTLLTDDLYSSKPELQNEDHPVITAMNTIGYDAMALGNHEFNFGTDLIKRVEKQAEFPLLSANTYVKATGKNFVKATYIKEVDGLKVAVIGMTIPHVPMWDGDKVKDLEFKPLNTEARKQVDELEKTEKPDVIVASIHAGLDNSDPGAAARNVIKEVPEIDAFVLGHDHREYAEHIEDGEGTPKPAAAVKDTGSGMVKIDLDLEKKDGKWEVAESHPETLSVKGVKGDEEVREATKEAHNKTVEHVNEVIGEAKDNFLPEERVPGIPEAQLQPTAMISLINNVQMKVTGADLGSAALFKFDSKLDKGPIKFSDVFSIYKYPNTLVATEMTGAQLKKYLEKQGGYYQQYEEGDVTIGFNPKVRVYNYDMISGVKYKFDISKPAGQRLKDLTFKGKEVKDDQVFKIAMNNYRFEGMAKDGLVNPEPYFESDPATLRGYIVDYIKEKKVIDPKEEIENNFEIIGADLDHPAREYILEQSKKGTEGFKIEASADGRTPNVKKLNANKLHEAGLIPDEYMKGADNVKIMHTNDMHGRMEYKEDKYSPSIGLGRVKTFKNNQKPDLLVDAGDAMQGLPISNYSKGMDMVKAMNAVGYDAMTLGNHEFDFGLDTALKYKEELNFPIVSANVYYKGKDERPFDPYVIKNKKVNGEDKKFALIGLTTPETSVKTHPNNVIKIDFKKPVPAADEAIKEIKKTEKIDYFVFMTHLGLDETTVKDETSTYLAEQLAKLYPEDKIFIADGHSHTPLEEGIKDNNVLIGQTGEHLNNVGMMTGDYTKEKPEVKAVLHPFSELKDLTPDPEVEKIVETAKTNFDKEMSAVALEDNKIMLNGERENVRTRETNLGNLIGDSLIAYGKQGFKDSSDFAIMNGGGIRTSIKPGKVTKGDIVGIMPFGNTVSQIKVTGNEIYAMFEHSLRSIHVKDDNGNVVLDENGVPALGANGGFLQVSDSIKVTYDSNLQGAEPENGVAGKRVTRIEVKDKSGKFVEVPRKDNVTYNMVTNDFLAAGGDGYTMLKGKPVEQGPSMDEVFMEYLTKLSAKELESYSKEIPYTRIIGKSSIPQGPAIKDGRYVQVVKKNYNLWSNFGWKKRNTSNNVLNEIFTSKYKYNHENGATYLSLYDSKGKWQGYINENATKVATNLQGDYIKYGKYVTINRTGYNTWSNFDWKERNKTDNLLGNTYQARGKYKHANGATYLSLYDNKGKWHGYVNKNAVKVGNGQQGAYISDGRYVTITKDNYNIWSNFNWKKRTATKKVLNETYQAKGRYKHFNGSTYYSLYNDKGEWKGYINANAVKVGDGRQGAYISYGKKVKINKKGYNTWSSFSWKKRNTTDKLMGKTFTAKGKYNHMNGATYYSLYDNDGKWHGYVNKNAVK